MKINLIAIGKKMPAWIETGYQEYAKRLPKACQLNLIELPLAHRGKSTSSEKIKAEEEKAILAAIPKDNKIIALDEHGNAWSTHLLAQKLATWQGEGRNISLLIGGPDGLSKTCLDMANETWSLSALTLPHPFVRVILAEQLYRAWSLLKNHPYHRD